MRPHSASDYTEQLRHLMPPGLAWSAGAGHAANLLAGEAEEMARLDARAIQLCLREFYAQTTRELLPEWEFEYGLPDPCRQLGATYEERIEDLLRKIRARGGQSIAYYVGLAKALGIDITITEFHAFRAGMSRTGERLFDRKWNHVFLVNGPRVRIYRFRTGRNSAGDRLRYWRGNEILECIINRLKPAHTYAMFGYQDGDAIFIVEEGNSITIRDDISASANDAIFDVAPDGSLSIRPNLEPGAENIAMRVDTDGNIIIFD